MDRLVLPTGLEASERILIAGAGGGFDIYAGLPIQHRLRSLGKEVFLANLSFTDLHGTNATQHVPSLFAVTDETEGEDSYFPERTLAKFVSRTLQERTKIYAFENVGVGPLTEGYSFLVESLKIDAIVLVDGGTDILLRGDESNLGTPSEDMASLAAVTGLNVKTKIVACVGFGVDAYHGVNHANWLENLAELTAEGAFLGAIALLASMPEVTYYLEAVKDADRSLRGRESIVNGSIASAIEGRFGNYHRYARTRQSQLFINPLMSLLWMCDLPSVARRNLYLDRLLDTRTNRNVQIAIEAFHASVPYRSSQSIPL